MTPLLSPSEVAGYLPPLLSAQEVATILGVSVEWVWKRAREIGGRKIGKCWRFRRCDVERYIQERFEGRAA